MLETEKIMDWIDVNDKTPEYDGEYLCYLECPQECDNLCKFQRVIKCEWNKWVVTERDGKVTHWRELPKPPKQ